MTTIQFPKYISYPLTGKILDAIKNNQDVVEVAKSYDKNPLLAFIDTLITALEYDPSYCYYAEQDKAREEYASQLISAIRYVVRPQNVTQSGSSTYSKEINSYGIKIKLVDSQDTNGKHSISLLKIAENERNNVPVGLIYDFSFDDIRKYDYKLSCDKLTQVFQELSGDNGFKLETLALNTDDNGIICFSKDDIYYQLEDDGGGVQITKMPSTKNANGSIQIAKETKIAYIENLTLSNIREMGILQAYIC